MNILLFLCILTSFYRLAANEKQYISTIMQIRDPRHKRRLIIKATDIVLFGPPQRLSFNLSIHFL